MIENSVFSTAHNRRVIDLKSTQDMTDLMAWCEAQWLPTFVLPFRSYNPPVFHSCCISFSRRGFALSAGHPAALSHSCRHIGQLFKGTSHYNLFDFILSHLQIRQAESSIILFPTVNSYHHSSFSANSTLEHEVSVHNTQFQTMLIKKIEMLEEETSISRYRITSC